MSINMIVYIKDFKNITKEDCEKYLTQFGIKAQVHPETDFETKTGFLPFKVEFPLCDQIKGKAFMSGFEMYPEVYNYQQELREKNKSQEPLPPKAQGINGLFKKRSILSDGIKEDIQEFIVNPNVDNVLKECGYSILLRFWSMDECILALGVTSYLAETGRGVVCDPQSGDYFYKDINQEFSKEIKQAFDLLEPDALHPFEGWV